MIDIKNIIIDKLKGLNPARVILFGSYACGKPGEDSDIDLLVVLNDNKIPVNFKEKLQKKRIVCDALLDITKKISTDIIVFTKPEWKRFVEMGSSFSKEIIKQGIRLL